MTIKPTLSVLSAVLLLTPPLVGQSPEAKRAFDEGLARYLEADYGESAPYFLEAARLDREYPEALLYGALSLNNLGRFARSDSLIEILARMEDRLDAYDRGWLGYLQHRLDGDYDGAMRALERSVELQPESKAGYNYAWLAIGLNRSKAAQRALEAVDPDVPPRTQWTSYWNLVVTSHLMLAEYENALEAGKKAREQFPTNVFVAGLEAFPLAALGRVDELRILLESISDYENRGFWRAGGVMSNAALVLRRHGHGTDADRILRMALDWFENRPAEEAATENHRSWVAWTLLASGRWDEARRAHEELATDFPEDLDYRGLVGASAGLGGDLETARSASEALGRVDRPYLFGEHLFWRAAVAASLGQEAEAVRLLEASRKAGQRYSWFWRYHPAFEPVADSPGFQTHLRPEG